MAEPTCGSETLATQLMNNLTAGVDFNLPEVNLDDPLYSLPTEDKFSAEISRLTNADLTERKLEGEGTFDYLMGGFKAHLKNEFEQNRITGAEYAKVYMALTESAMSNGVQFLLGRDQAYWAAVTAQLNAKAAEAAVITARVQLATAKVQLVAMQFEANTNKVNYALTKLKLSTESIGFCSAKFNYVELMPLQKLLLIEQVNTQRAQTTGTRSDGDPVEGQVGKQIELYDQQITSYKRDSEVKAAKLFTDAWITMKTIDEGLLPPDGFVNASLDDILTKLKLNNDLN